MTNTNKINGLFGPREIAIMVENQGPKLEKSEVIMGEGPIGYTGRNKDK